MIIYFGFRRNRRFVASQQSRATLRQVDINLIELLGSWERFFTLFPSCVMTCFFCDSDLM